MENKKIFDFEELNERLNRLNNLVEEQPIGYTYFNYPIRHFSYGHGDYHVILTSGTHANELITIHYLIQFMELLNSNNLIDKNTYTIHFIPMVNPEGNIIVTSAIRTLIHRNDDEKIEETYCIQWYLNAKADDKREVEEKYQGDKLKYLMFKDAIPECIGDKHKGLRENVQKIMNQYNHPRGSLINWSANGRGVDLNENTPTTPYYDYVISGTFRNNKLGSNIINLSVPNPFGCAFIGDHFEYEKENISLLNFYKEINDKHYLIGSIIYHSCGDLVRYLEGIAGVKNPWNENISDIEFNYNKSVAETYGKYAKYKLMPTTQGYNTVSSQLESKYPGTILVELAYIRANPLSQFINGENNIYDNLMINNNEAIIHTIDVMKENYLEYVENNKNKTP